MDHDQQLTEIELQNASLLGAAHRERDPIASFIFN
ncbi:hypothetical protein CFP56_012996 [Quercus suber]|uniref:Uncharacterized protein n=1 Tax=Quercus suber TaxID=58331 RepID=A0AAW0KV73_QUESU